MELFKQEYPSENAFWIASSREKAVSGPTGVKYIALSKRREGSRWEPHMIFVLYQNDKLVWSVPDVGPTERLISWDLAQRRSINKADHKLEEVDLDIASGIGMQIESRLRQEGKRFLEEWEKGKYDDLYSSELDGLGAAQSGSSN